VAGIMRRHRLTRIGRHVAASGGMWQHRIRPRPSQRKQSIRWSVSDLCQARQTLPPITHVRILPFSPGDCALIRTRCRAAARRLSGVSVLLALAAGCTRGFFRERADRDVEALLTEKSIDPRWDVRTRNWYVYPDPRARFADADKPDHPKKPPDDPATAALSPDPQPIRSHFCSGPDQEGVGYLEFLRHCDQHNRNRLVRPTSEDGKPAATLGAPTGATGTGDTSDAEQGRRSLDRALQTFEPAFLITLDQAVELAQFNSRELQDRREDLYGAALPVTFERFQFVPQVFAGIEAIRTWRASGVLGGPGSSWNINTTGQVSQLFPTGAALVAKLGNQLVIDLGTGQPHVGISNLALTLTQPLLRGGGWAVTLEPLTQAERTLVYAVRSYARFRENHFVYVAGGTDLANSVFGYTGLGNPALGLIGTQAPSQGYLPTLLNVALERNERENLTTLTGYLALFREYQGRGDFSELQVGQVEQQILRSQSNLLAQRQNLQFGLDQFKLQLGLPTRLGLELDDGPTKPVRNMLAEFTRARTDFESLRDDIDRFRNNYRVGLMHLAGPLVVPVPLEVPLRAKIESSVFDSRMTRSAPQFRAKIPGRWDRWRQMTTEALRAELKRLADEYRTLDVKEAAAEAKNEKLPPADKARLEALGPDIALGQLELSLRAYEAFPQQKDRTPRGEAVLYEDAVNNFMRVMNEARQERRTVIRGTWPALPPVAVDGIDMLRDDQDRAQTAASQVALGNRLELMTARAQVVDAWRQVAVTANSLLGVANVGYNFTTPSTPNANEPFALGGTRSTHQLILTGELPLVRRAERNAYRSALIGYQRARRNLQATEDFILTDVRNDLRTLRVLAENYRIQKRAVEVAYDQVENSLDVLQSPPEGGGALRPAGQGAANAGNAAALTNQLLSAQTSLVTAQNALYQVWISYQIARMTFFRDIERLPLDLRGVWIDEYCPSPPLEERQLPPPHLVAEPGPVAAEPERFADERAAGDR
jgi:hypothetical protein